MMNLTFLKSKIPSERYSLRFRGSLLITAASIISLLETEISIFLGFRKVSFEESFLIIFVVVSLTAILVSITYFKKNLLVWHEWSLFGIYLIFFLFIFSIWVYRLGDLRLLALINAITSITILLSYATIIQALLLSAGALICYFAVTWYSISIAGQSGSLLREAFFTLCMVPSFIFISLIADYINKNREELKKTQSDLEKTNSELSIANVELKNEQVLAEVEMDLAKEIQNVIFPAKPPEVSDWDLALFTKPYGAVTGDFYDIYTSGNMLDGISLFDVSGHGVAPALITILAKPFFYNHFMRLKSEKLGAVIESADSDLLKELEAVNLYITGLMLRINGSEVEYVNAGHPDLLHFQKAEKKVILITDPENSFKGRPVGVGLSRKEYVSLKFKVLPGDYIIIYSDGLTESKNKEGEQFGMERLSNVICSSESDDAAGMLEHIKNYLNDFTGDVKAGDDITLILAMKK